MFLQRRLCCIPLSRRRSLKQLAHVRLKENVRGVEVPQAKFELLFLGGLQAAAPVVRGRTSCKAFDQLDRVLDLMNQRGAFFCTTQPRVERDTVQTRIKGSLDVIRNAEVQHGVVAQLRVGGKERVVPDQLIQLPGAPRFLAVIDEVHLAVVDLEAPLAVVAAIPAGLPAHRLIVRAPLFHALRIRQPPDICRFCVDAADRKSADVCIIF